AENDTGFPLKACGNDEAAACGNDEVCGVSGLKNVHQAFATASSGRGGCQIRSEHFFDEKKRHAV
ncbi:hypothetical protein, partial [Undibacterium sp. 5I2]|uniref:hypothetical protein n=1 Tax=Undibacterium sp. 5I2 TaxID=3048591 RepID=UPI002B23C7EB